MKKSKLVIDYDYNFELMGITSPAQGYRLAWEMNRRLGIHLVKQPDLIVGFRNNEERAFSIYAYETPLNRLKLLKNRPHEQDQGKYFLVPEFPHYDFIILAAMELHTREHLLDLIKSIPFVQFTASIPLEGLKSKSNFIF